MVGPVMVAVVGVGRVGLQQLAAYVDEGIVVAVGRRWRSLLRL